MNQQLKIWAECTLFFEANPFTYETGQGVAERLGRRVEHVQSVLEQLVQISILERIGNGERALYRYVQPDTTVIG